MSFFDDKQEIIKLELTTYGRFLLSRGKFKPVYYAFFDDDVIYDSLYANLSESQNSTQDRIFDETPSLKPQTTYTSIEDSVKLNKLVLREIDKLKEEESQISADKNYALSLPLANSSLSSDYSPAWSLSFISGSISSSQPYIDNSDGLSGSLQPYLRVPQINLLDNVYDIKMKKNDFSLDNNYKFVTVEVSGSDQYVYSIKDNELILSVLESNVDNLTKNFDVEVFIEEEEKILGRDEKKKILKKLNFKKDPLAIVNNILLDNPITFEVQEDENYVEYFFELTIDDEIEIPPQEAAKPTGTGTSTYQTNVKNGPFGVDC
jgi:hypothetical protein